MQTLRIKVKPNARDSSLFKAEDGSWTATIKSAPVEGKANEELRRLVADRFGVSRTQVNIRSGSKSRTKTVTIDRL